MKPMRNPTMKRALQRTLVLVALSTTMACNTTPEPFFDPTEDRYDLGSELVKESPKSPELSSKELNLNLSLRLALQQNPQLKSLTHKIDQAAANTVQARLWPNPSFNISSEEGPVDDG
ncbi:MAG: TolC family protein, partial [Planctomycetota bacterium]|nr:TolC family protein [Planctomycetota bacterium]